MLKTYAHHKPTPQAIEDIRQIRLAFSELHEKLDKLCVSGREKAVAITHLETAAMWAIKAVVCNDPESEVEYINTPKENQT